MSLFNDAILASDIKISLHRLYEDLDEGEVIESLTGLVLERTQNGLNVHFGGKITHIDKELFPHLFVGCKEYNRNALLKFVSYLQTNKTENEVNNIILTLVDELMPGIEPCEQLYLLLKSHYEKVHIVISDLNKCTCVGELPVNSELVIKRA